MMKVWDDQGEGYIPYEKMRSRRPRRTTRKTQERRSAKVYSEFMRIEGYKDVAAKNKLLRKEKHLRLLKKQQEMARKRKEKRIANMEAAKKRKEERTKEHIANMEFQLHDEGRILKKSYKYYGLLRKLNGLKHNFTRR